MRGPSGESHFDSSIGRNSGVVLLVEDNADMRDYIRELLAPYYEVICASDGNEGLKSALSRHPDLVLTDVMMPVLNGIGLLQALRADPETSALPVILISARADDDARIQGLEALANDYLIKPFTARELLARVKTHLSISRLQRGVSRLITQENERRRVARELHDELGQLVALAAFEADRAKKLSQNASPEVRDAIGAVSDVVAQFAPALRAVSHRLHPAVLEGFGLVEALRSLVKEYEHLCLNVTFVACDTPDDLSTDVATALYRIAQEAIRNVQKHAANASVRVSLTKNEQTLKLEIQDTGPGFDSKARRNMDGLGLLSMQERARLAGGSFRLESGSGAGTLIEVQFPLTRKNSQSTYSSA